MKTGGRWVRRGLMAALAVLMTLISVMALTTFLQSGWSHRHGAFAPKDAQVDLTGLLDKPHLSSQDYDLLYRQTGLSPAAVQDHLRHGAEGRQAILDTQEGFYETPAATCVSLIGGRFTCEDLLLDEQGKKITSVPLAPLRAGDILLSFSTHTLGWRHGHAGLVLGPDRVLEAVQIGTNSYQASAKHWRSYSNFMVLRVKDAARQLGEKVAQFARRVLDDVPYSLLPGITTPKGAPVEKTAGVHCAYLPWYAWQEAGIDLDANGGQIVTVADLARSPALEVVQVYGMDPELVKNHRAEF